MANDAIQRTMVKKVKIHAPIAIKTVNPTIYGDIAETTMTPANIMKCLIGRATVWEILSDGSLLKLNDHNYNKVNTPTTKVNETHTLVKDVDKTAFAKTEEEAGYKTMVLSDKITINDQIEIDRSAAEDLNKKIEEVGEIPAPKSVSIEECGHPLDDMTDEETTADFVSDPPNSIVPFVAEKEDKPMTEEEELAKLEAEIAALDEAEKKEAE